MERTTEWTGGTSRAIMAGLRERVRPAVIRRRDRIEEHVGRYWISWRSGNRNRVFAEIRALQGRVQVFILPGPRDLRDSTGLARRAPRTQGWGWFRSRIEVSSLDGVEPAAKLIVQSYERVVSRGNGGRDSRAARRTQAL
jgi:predicted transport protein